MDFKLSNSVSNTRQLNGWNYNHEKLFNSLTWQEKEAINLLIIEQFEFFKKNGEALVKKNKTVIHLTDKMIDDIQMELLRKEVIALTNVSTS